MELAHRELFAPREGRIIDLLIKDDRVVRGIVTPAHSAPALENADLIFRVCSAACEKRIRRSVPAALRDIETRLGEEQS